MKTRIAMIVAISPRLLDPKAKSDEIVGRFRYTDEKDQVELALKSRARAIDVASSKAAGRGNGRGRGGRNGMSRGLSNKKLSNGDFQGSKYPSATERQVALPGSILYAVRRWHVGASRRTQVVR